jgi:ribonuclease P protein subunit POP4
MITPKNLIRHELISLEVEIADSTDPSLKGLKGRVIDETKNMFTIEVSGRRKMVPKGVCTFRFKLAEDLVEVAGRAFIGKPQDRIKK